LNHLTQPVPLSLGLWKRSLSPRTEPALVKNLIGWPEYIAWFEKWKAERRKKAKVNDK